MTGARVRLSAGARRQAILAAARGVFGRAGYHETTTRDIAAAAGVSEGLLYQHFTGKRQLFEELVMTAAADLERRLLAASAQDDRMAAGIAAYFDFVSEQSDLYVVFFRQAVHADPAFQRLADELCRRFVQLVQDRSIVSEVGARALNGMLQHLALWWSADRRIGRDEIVERATRMARALIDTEDAGAGW